jgi:hypothetical protein
MAGASEIFSLRKTRQSRFVVVLYSLFLSLYLGFVLPAHHHSDGQEHNNCSLCIVQHQPSLTEIAFSIPIAAPFLAEVVLVPDHHCILFCHKTYQTRAPPSLLCANS